MTPAGLEPAIPGSVGRCLIHWATGPDSVLGHIATAAPVQPTTFPRAAAHCTLCSAVRDDIPNFPASAVGALRFETKVTSTFAGASEAQPAANALRVRLQKGRGAKAQSHHRPSSSGSPPMDTVVGAYQHTGEWNGQAFFTKDATAEGGTSLAMWFCSSTLGCSSPKSAAL